MRKLFLVLLLISCNAGAETVPLPPSVSSVDDIVSEFRNIFTTKINELGKNFITLLSDKTIVFTSNTTIRCNGNSILAGEPLASMQYNFKKTGAELNEKAVYTGCNGQISLVEDVITRGGKLTPLKYDDFIKGKRTFDLADDEVYKLYRLSNSDNEEIFKMLIERNQNSKIVEFYFVGEKFLRMNYDFQESTTRLTLTYFPFKGKYVRKHGTWSFNRSFDAFTNTVLVTKGALAQVNYLNTNGELFSQTDYLSRFDKFITSSTLSTIRGILDYHNYYFPETKIVQTGGANERLKEELRLAFNRLQNNTELNLVKKLVQDYIDAVEKGLISDNRPKE
ncbi:MAG: hypothetical protein WC635_02370 [Bacteriovorax sp.]|jgi:hypothetical protein